MHKTHSAVLGLDDVGPEMEDDGKQGTEGTVQGPETGDEADKRGTPFRVWLSLIEAVSDITKYNWGEIYEMSINEFLAYVAYYQYKMKKKEQELKEFRRKHK